MGLEEQTETREIGGFMYKMTPLPFGVGVKALRRTMAVASPIISAAFSGQGAASYAAIFQALPSAVSDDDLAYFADLFGTVSRYQDGDKWVPLVQQNREFHFAKRYFDFLKWVGFGLDVNFRDILSGQGSGIGDLVTGLVTKTAG